MLPTDLIDRAKKGKPPISAVTADSRQVAPGGAFFAVKGGLHDGFNFIGDAIASGAKVIVYEMGRDISGFRAKHPPVEFFSSHDVRHDLAIFAAALHHPQPKYALAVTGTDGKTSTAGFIRQLLALTGHKAASIGTLGLVGAQGEKLAGDFGTSPDPVLLAQHLQDLAKQGYEAVVIEASSHGLDQRRLDGLRFATAGFTNFSQDHLDYHRTMAAYFTAKKRLFTDLLATSGTAVLNADELRYDELREVCEERSIKVLDYGRDALDLKLHSATPGENGLEMNVEWRGGGYHIHTMVYGDFQAHNLLCAAAMTAMAFGDENKIGELLSLLELLSAAEGRLDPVAVKRMDAGEARIFVDYAHTPAALEGALTALRPYAGGRLAVVLGCGGDRDRGKRPLMGEVAKECADLVIVTDDNPRSEDPASIRAEIMEGCPGATEIGDRREAIAFAIGQLRPDDLLLVAGKGHERTQIVGSEIHQFYDPAVIRECLGE